MKLYKGDMGAGADAKAAAEFFGPDGRHGKDCTFFYNNIKDNVAKRIAAYQAVRANLEPEPR